MRLFKIKTAVRNASNSRLPMEYESHCLWGLHPRNESRAGFHMQPIDKAFSLSILLLFDPDYSSIFYSYLKNTL